MPTYNREYGWRRFLQTCQAADSIKQLDKYLELLLTQEEREDIAGRSLIIQELLRGKLSQRDMSDKLNVSIAKITRGSNALKLIDENLKKLLVPDKDP